MRIVVNVFFFPDRNNENLAINHRSLELLLLSVFPVALLLLCRVSWLIELASGKIGLATAIICLFLGATAGVRYGMICVTKEQQYS